MVIYSGVLLLVVSLGFNALFMLRGWRARKHAAMSDAELNLFRNLRGLSPEQFRKLMKAGAWQESTVPITLTREGQMPEELFYVLEGALKVEKSGRSFSLVPAAFVGELAYLRGLPATASVELLPPGRYVSWKAADLNRITSRDEGLRAALAMLINNDLAEKVARS